MIDLYLPPKPAIIRLGEPWENRLRENLARARIPFGIQLAIVAEMRRLVGSNMAVFGQSTKDIARFAGKGGDNLTLHMAGMLLNPYLFGGAPPGTPSSLGSTSTTTASGTSMTHITTAAIVAGRLVVVGIMLNTTNSVNATSVSDGTNTYTKAANTTGVTNSEIWYCENAAGVGSGATLTVNYSTAGSMTGAIFMAQVSGVATSSSKDKTGTGTASNSTISAATGILSQSNEIVFGMTAQASSAGSYSGASGFTNIAKAENIASTGGAFDYQIVADTATVTFTPTWASPGSITRNSAAVASFKGL